MEIEENFVYSALDLGTNTTLLLNVVKETPGKLREVGEFYRTTQLGQDLNVTGELSQEAVDRTLQAVAFFLRATKDKFAHGKGIAVATSAVRDAVNSESFLSAFADLVGSKPLVLTGIEEAGAIFTGAVNQADEKKKLLCLDIGGGSTELAGGNSAQCDFCTSLNLGCVRIAERYNLFEENDVGVVTAARDAVRAELEKAVCQYRDTIFIHTPIELVFTGGTATTYAAYRQALADYNQSQIHGFRGDRETVGSDVERLMAMSSRQRAVLPGIPNERARIFPAGLLILQEFLQFFGKTSFRVSTRGLRHGLVIMLNQQQCEPTWTW